VARDGLIAEADRLGWSHRLMRDHETFCRLVLTDTTGHQVLVDLAVDSAPGQPSTITLLGPTFAPEESAGRKVVHSSTVPKPVTSSMYSPWHDGMTRPGCCRA
jgi:hypothetical protein